ncbi:MAG: cytochrome c1 [Hyphomicrobiales bacterium]|nr:cytochrome c1 [Hyphomicrobiales bacterium]MDE2017758.1 cytochrome c1 [Hyphomicrobiales bacterium]
MIPSILRSLVRPLALCAAFALAAPAFAQQAEEQPIPTHQSWSFAGPFGRYDTAQLQRGFKVYKEVCSNCHALGIPFRTLSQPGGPEFSKGQVEALAATYQIDDVNDKGEAIKRPGRPADTIPWIFANKAAAAAAFGKAPPNMNLLAKARSFSDGFPWFVVNLFTQYQEQGPDWIYAILNGYSKPEDRKWNLYFPGHAIAMPSPLDSLFDPKTGKALNAGFYTDGTPVTKEQVSKDVAAFLMWAAEPSLDARKRIGFRVMAFLIAFAFLAYFTKKKVWSDVHAHA